MPTARIVLGRSQAEDLAALCSIGGERLSRIARTIEDSKPTINWEKIGGLIGAEPDEETSRSVRRVLLGLGRASRRGVGTIAELLNSVGEFLQSQWDEPRLEQWRECRPAIERLLNTESVVLASKAADLATDFDRLLVGARILTDIRPVFDVPRDEIIGSVITQTLIIEYISPEGEQGTLSVAVDSDDIEELRKACETAAKKSKIARTVTENKLRVEAIMSGEEWT